MLFYLTRQLQGYKESRLVLRENVSGFYHPLKRMLSIFLSRIYTSAKGKKFKLDESIDGSVPKKVVRLNQNEVQSIPVMNNMTCFTSN